MSQNAMLPSSFKLATRRATATPLGGKVAWLLLGVLGGAIVLATTAHAPQKIELTAKAYAKSQLTIKNYGCLLKLYGKESAWNPKAVGNLSGKQRAYGIPQIKNDIIKAKTPIEQVSYGLKYIGHRYGYNKLNQPNACKAWAHWVKRGWH